jgi:hypothetical protein
MNEKQNRCAHPPCTCMVDSGKNHWQHAVRSDEKNAGRGWQMRPRWMSGKVNLGLLWLGDKTQEKSRVCRPATTNVGASYCGERLSGAVGVR